MCKVSKSLINNYNVGPLSMNQNNTPTQIFWKWDSFTGGVKIICLQTIFLTLFRHVYIGIIQKPQFFSAKQKTKGSFHLLFIFFS